MNRSREPDQIQRAYRLKGKIEQRNLPMAESNSHQEENNSAPSNFRVRAGHWRNGKNAQWMNRSCSIREGPEDRGHCEVYRAIGDAAPQVQGGFFGGRQCDGRKKMLLDWLEVDPLGEVEAGMAVLLTTGLQTRSNAVE